MNGESVEEKVMTVMSIRLPAELYLRYKALPLPERRKVLRRLITCLETALKEVDMRGASNS